jgi:hypothetical protein
MAENSVITKYRREKLCLATSGGAGQIAPITHIAFGDGGVDAEGSPIPPSGAATALSHEIARYETGAAAYPVSTTARYTATIPKNALAGAAISEAALVDGSGGVCAIKTMYVKRKDDGVTFAFTFDDEF